MSRFDEAKKMYASLGVDAEAAIEQLKDVCISVHCWQGDDVGGFDSPEALSGGIQTTGNYPGKARTPAELMADIDKAFSLMPGKKKLNLHACYAIFDGAPAGRDQLEPKHFKAWVDYAKARNLGIDFNPTFFAHPMVKDNLTLSSPDETVRRYWVEHGKACIRISEYFAEETGVPCVMNIWIPDGYKDIPADRLGPRARFRKSLDEILSIPYDKTKVYVTLESKVFGIGLESYTVGSAEFCLSYSTKAGITPLMDNGHYHPTEVVSDKISSLLLFNEKIALPVPSAGTLTMWCSSTTRRKRSQKRSSATTRCSACSSRRTISTRRSTGSPRGSRACATSRRRCCSRCCSRTTNSKRCRTVPT